MDELLDVIAQAAREFEAARIAKERRATRSKNPTPGRPPSSRLKVLEALSTGESLRAEEIAGRCGMPVGSIHGQLFLALKAGQVVRLARGVYRLAGG